MVEDQQPLVNGDHHSETESEMVEEEPENMLPSKEARSSRSKSPDKAKKRDQQQRSEEDKDTPRRKKRSKLSKSKETEEEEAEASDTVMTEEEKPEKSALDHIPDDIRFDPKSLENKPKGLVDALSNFFTPGLKRTSRTAMNSLLKPESKEPEQQQQEVKKVRLSVDDKEGAGEKDGDKTEAERKRHASAGQQQVLQKNTWQ